ncbi:MULTISPECIES: hypothetical protein [Aquimarina]|uniref:hypothetical protein n=1 Tax=Aquimarina TaxID=290174 RepID=UPI000D69FCD6|nr:MULTISPECIES: hypothetical protein [Aquimarina]
MGGIRIITIIFATVFMSCHIHAQIDAKLIGKWSLIKIEDSLDTISPPKTANYDLIISDTTFSFSVGVNTCGYAAKTIKNTIIGAFAHCTEACCDDKVWKHFEKINYQGDFSLEDDGNTLIIVNQSGKVYLQKID